ncbi:MAG: hypothetical protein WAW13_05195, partial [Minisyncoccia bacterium]
PVADAEAKTILGSRKYNGGDVASFDWSKWATQMAITVGISVVASGVNFNGGSLGWSSINTRGISQGFTNSFASYYINRAVFNAGQLSGWNPSTTRIIGGTLSGAALGGIGGLNSAITSTSTLGRVFTGASSGLVYSGVGDLARHYGVSDSIASLTGSITSMFAAGTINGALNTGSFKGALSGGFANLTGENFKNNILPNVIAVGTEEVLRLTTNLDPAYNKMVGAAMRTGFNARYNENMTLPEAVGNGLIDGGLSYATARMEKELNFENPFMEAFVVNTATAALRGAALSSVSNTLEKENFAKASLLESTISSVLNS